MNPEGALNGNINLEFELKITFNTNKCWALYDNLKKFKKFAYIYPNK